VQAYYLPNVNRTNLIVLTGAEVHAINFKPRSSKEDDLVASGVTYTYMGKSISVSAGKEVILSAG
jgi:hypothetical protein